MKHAKSHFENETTNVVRIRPLGIQSHPAWVGIESFHLELSVVRKGLTEDTAPDEYFMRGYQIKRMEQIEHGRA
jgi:hypothetical protein